jgi:hypothetical protein
MNHLHSFEDICEHLKDYQHGTTLLAISTAFASKLTQMSSSHPYLINSSSNHVSIRHGHSGMASDSLLCLCQRI